MGHWARTLDVKDLWSKAEDQEITPKQLAQGVMEKLKELQPYIQSPIERERQKLIEELRTFAESPDDPDFDDFDELLERLYDWADRPTVMSGREKACWVAAF